MSWYLAAGIIAVIVALTIGAMLMRSPASKAIEGTPASAPDAPTPTSDPGIYQTDPLPGVTHAQLDRSDVQLTSSPAFALHHSLGLLSGG